MSALTNRHDIKLKKAESNFKLREQRIKEFEKESSEKQKIGVILRKELKNNLNISNLEMDKKLLEVASKNKKKHDEEIKAIEQTVIQEEAEDVVECCVLEYLFYGKHDLKNLFPYMSERIKNMANVFYKNGG